VQILHTPLVRQTIMAAAVYGAGSKGSSKLRSACIKYFAQVRNGSKLQPIALVVRCARRSSIKPAQRSAYMLQHFHGKGFVFYGLV